MSSHKDLPAGGPFVLLLSAAVFGYFGFVGSWTHQYTTDVPPKLLIMVALLKWTLRIGAIVFLAAALLAMARLAMAGLLSAVAGLTSAGVFIAVAVWEWTNPKGYFSGVPAFLLLIFAIWNGYGAVAELQEFRQSRAPASPDAPRS